MPDTILEGIRFPKDIQSLDFPALEELAEGLGRRCPELSVRRLGGELLLSPVREWMRA